MCAKAGPRIPRSSEVLLRQVNPSWLDGDEPSSQSFYPWRDLDEECLSVDRGSLTSAADAHRLFTAPSPTGFGMASMGVWGVSVEEVEDAGLSSWDDKLSAIPPKPANPAHALIEFAPLSKKQQKALGRRLKVLAIARGRLHP